MEQASVAFNQKLNIRGYLSSKDKNDFYKPGEIIIEKTDEVRNQEFQLRVLYYHRWKEAERKIKQLEDDAFVSNLCIQNYVDAWKRVTESKLYRLWNWIQEKTYQWKTFYKSTHLKSVRCYDCSKRTHRYFKGIVLGLKMCPECLKKHRVDIPKS